MPNCKSDQIINPQSGRCVSKTGKIGKQLLKGNVQDKVPKTVPNKIPKKVLDHPDKDVLRLEICGKDMIRNPNTGRCVKISGPIAKKLMSVPYLIVNPEKPVGPIKPVKYVKPFKPKPQKGYDKTGLDQNDDGFISANEYMDATKSLGPLEKKEGGFSSYQQADIGIRFILSLIRNQKGPIHHIGCIPLYALCVYKDSAGNYNAYKSVIEKLNSNSYLNCDKNIPGYTFGSSITSYATILMMYAPTNNKFISPKEKSVILIAPNLEETLSKCKNNGKTMAVCELSLITTDDPYDQDAHGHANVIIFDIKRKTIERFDPHGANEYVLPSNLKYDDIKSNITGKKDFKFGKQHSNKFGNIQIKLRSGALYDQDAIDKLLSAQFKKVLPDYTYYGTNETTPYLGPQIKADAFTGLCATWSCMYMILRLLNPDLNPIEVTRRMIDGTREQLLDRILRFQKYIIRTLRKESILDKSVVPSAYL